MNPNQSKERSIRRVSIARWSIFLSHPNQSEENKYHVVSVAQLQFKYGGLH